MTQHYRARVRDEVAGILQRNADLSPELRDIYLRELVGAIEDICLPQAIGFPEEWRKSAMEGKKS